MLSKRQDVNITAEPLENLLSYFAAFTNTDSHSTILVDCDANLCALNRVAQQALRPLCKGDNLRLYCKEPERLDVYLRRCAGTTGPLPASFTLQVPDQQPMRWRCDGGFLQPIMEAQPTLLILRLKPQQSAHTSFLALTSQVDALNAALQRQEKTQIQLERALAAKEILLSEVQHRIKNNLQIVLSMLSLAINRAPDAVSQTVLKEASSRVNAMGTVHSLFYETPDLTDVDCAQLIMMLAKASEQAYGRADVDLVVDAQPLPLRAEDALSLALIINELISNAYKHGFTDGKGGAIHIDLIKHADHAAISVRDDGLAFMREEQGTGLSLVKALAAKLGGEFTLEQLPKRVSVSFPLKNKNLSASHIN